MRAVKEGSIIAAVLWFSKVTWSVTLSTYRFQAQRSKISELTHGKLVVHGLASRSFPLVGWEIPFLNMLEDSVFHLGLGVFNLHKSVVLH